MIDAFLSLDSKIQSAIISALVSISIFLLGIISKFLIERYSIDFKLNREYQYEQRKKIKETS